MTHLTRTSIALAFAALAPISALSSQPAPLALSSGAELTAPTTDPITIAERWRAAEALRAEGRLAESMRAFEEIARIQSATFENASRTYWILAEIRYAMGDDRGTANALDAAAEQAGRFGDVEMQARALFEAAVAYANARDQQTAHDRMDHLEVILESPMISDALRTQIHARTQGSRG